MEEEVGKHGQIVEKMPLNSEVGTAGLMGQELTGQYQMISEIANTILQL